MRKTLVTIIVASVAAVLFAVVADAQLGRPGLGKIPTLQKVTEIGATTDKSVTVADTFTVSGTPVITTGTNEILTIDPDGTGYTRVGSAGSPTYANGADDFFVCGDIESVGSYYVTYPGAIRVDTSSNFWIGSTAGTQARIGIRGGSNPDALHFAPNDEANYIVFCDEDDWTTSWNHAQTTNPTIYIQSADATQVNDHLALYHDQTDARITAGNGNVKLDAEDTDGIIEVVDVLRGETSLWYHYRQVGAVESSPGGSGATFTAPTSDGDPDTIGGYLLDADAEYLYFGFDVHDDWDEATDIEIEVYFEVSADNSGGTGTDTADFSLVSYFKQPSETAAKTQTIADAVTVGACGQYAQFVAEFAIDYDDGSNPVEEGDVFNIRLNFVTGTSEVSGVIVNHFEIKYKTAQIGIEV